MSESSEGQRLSGAIGGFRGPGLVVVPLRLHWEFLEPIWLRRCGQHVCASFFLHLTLVKNMTIVTRDPSSPLPGRTTGICGCGSSSQVALQTRRERGSIKDPRDPSVGAQIFLLCCTFFFLLLCFWFHCCTFGTASQSLR